MKTTSLASVARQPVPQTLTLDMELPPAPVRRTRAKPVPEAPIVIPPAQAKPVIKKGSPRNEPPAAMKPKAAGKAKTAMPTPDTVRVERDLALEGGRLWRMSGRHAVAYVHSAGLACALLAVETRHLARHAMAVYYDKKGRAIAWQVRFDTQHWDDVMRQLG